jgi:KaiC/GvpD/RAD55 family RecA-like ATPase
LRVNEPPEFDPNIDPFADIPVATNVVPIRDEVPSHLDEGIEAIYGAPGTPGMSDAAPKPPLPLQYFEDIQEQLTGLWLVKRLLPTTGIAVLYGHPGSGKTFLAFDWGMHVALGWDWHGHKVKQGLVVIIAAEGVSGLRNRISAFRRHHNVKKAPVALIPVGVDLQAPDADTDRVIDAIREAEKHFEQSAALIIIDTLSKTFGAGKENTDDMVTYISNCQRIANQFECLTMPVHHRPKDAESEEPRGHSSLKGGAETVLLVESGEIKKVRVTKQKDGEDGLEMLFRLKVVGLGEDEDGEPVTSCVVEQSDVAYAPASDTPAAKAMRLPDGAKLALHHLDNTTERVGMIPPPDIPDDEINRLKVGKVVRIDDWREKCASASGHAPDTKPDTLSKAFRRNLEKLQSLGIVKVWKDYAWRTWESRTHAGHYSDTELFRDRTSGHSGAPTTWAPGDVRDDVRPSPTGDLSGPASDDDYVPLDWNDR